MSKLQWSLSEFDVLHVFCYNVHSSIGSWLVCYSRDLDLTNPGARPATL